MKMMQITKGLVALALSLVPVSTFAWGSYTQAPGSYYGSQGLPVQFFDGKPNYSQSTVVSNTLYSTNYQLAQSVIPQTYAQTPVVSTGYIPETRIIETRDITPLCAVTVTRTLSLGMRGEDVATVQDYLNNQDFMPATPNGYYGYGTEAAVKRFQAAYGIRQTGTVGPQTRDVLNRLICGDRSVGVVTQASTIAPLKDITPSRIISTPSTVATPSTSFVNTGSSSINPGLPLYPPSNYPFNQYINPAYQVKGASLIVTMPSNKAGYREGDTVHVSWASSNLVASRYVVSLGSMNTTSEKQLAVLPGTSNTTSFVLTKELLDSVCLGTTACSGPNYRVYVTAYTSALPQGEYTIKAYADQISITRPLTTAGISLTASKTPVNSGETINLYVHVPATAGPFAQYNSLYWKVRALCPTGVQITINGQACGTESYVYQQNIMTAPDIRVTLTNNSWGPQQVILEAEAYNYFGGQLLGKGTTAVVINK